MATMSFKMTAAYFDSKGVKYTAHEEDSVLHLIYGMDNKEKIDIIVRFDEGDSSVWLGAYSYVKFPEEKLALMYETCSKMNSEFRWVKFYVDEEDLEIRVRDDAVIQLDSCGEEIHELVRRMVGIADEAYPTFMKAVWA